jgi:MFS family permease
MWRVKVSGPLAERRFQLLWSGQSVSQVGNAVVPVALALAVVDATGSATDLGLVLAATAIPRLVLLLVGGVIADRFPRNRVMLGADLVNLVAQGLIGLELLSGQVNIAHLVVLSAASGAATAFFGPASGAIVPATVEASQLAKANALIGLSTQIATVAGPAIATALVLTVGAGWAFIANALSFGVSAATLAALRLPRQPVPVGGKFWTDLADGWRELRRHRWYWTNLFAHATWNLARSAYQALGPLVAVRALGGDVSWGYITQAAALGALVGAVLALRVRVSRPLVAANIGLSLAAIPLALLALRVPAPVTAAGAALMFGGLTVMQVHWQTTVQQRIPAAAMSRVMAYDWLVSLGLTPLGLALAGPLAEWIGVSTTLGAAAILVGGACLAVLGVSEVHGMRAPAPAPAPAPVRGEA